MVSTNPAAIRVYYDQELDRTEEQIRSELSDEVSALEGVQNVSITNVWVSDHAADEAQLTVEFDGTTTDVDVVKQDISLLSFVDKAINNQ